MNVQVRHKWKKEVVKRYKTKFTLEQVMNAQRGRSDIALLFL
jgi:hypothetical protein